MKRRIKMNLWGNWYGYEGSKRVKEFGLDSIAAEIWLGMRNEDAIAIKGHGCTEIKGQIGWQK